MTINNGIEQTYSVDLGYRVDSDSYEENCDQVIEAKLGERDSSGMGFGFRDMQWNGIPRDEKEIWLTKLTQLVDDTFLVDHLAYVTMYLAPNYDSDGEECPGQEEDIAFEFQAPWYEAEGRNNNSNIQEGGERASIGS